MNCKQLKLIIFFSDSSMFLWNNGRCYQSKPFQRLLKESVGYLLCVVYCLPVCMLGVCMYGGATAYPGSDKAKHWAIISLITEEQFICSLKCFNDAIYALLFILQGSPKHNKKAFYQCFVCVSCFTTGCTGMDSLHESQGECGLHARVTHAYAMKYFSSIQLLS